MSPAHVYKYEGPVIPLQHGEVWRTNGVFKIAHLVDLAKMNRLAEEIARETAALADRRAEALVDYHLNTAIEGINRLSGRAGRKSRSLDWLGSAWKWIAGSPDAADWNAVLAAQGMASKNNDQQLRINARLFDATHESIEQLNNVIAKVNAVDSDLYTTTTVLHKSIILSNQVSEVVRACQLAKTSIVDSNLLDHGEIDTILREVHNLPYKNAIEAIEFSRPTIVTNGTLLLYILAFPKVAAEKYRIMHLYATISEGKQIILEHHKLAASSSETYAVLGDCLSIGNTSVCRKEELQKLKEASCIPRLLKGGQARCSYQRNNQRVVKQVDDGMLYLTNFNGTLGTAAKNYNLSGSFVIQFDNETITVDGQTYSSYSISHLMAMPAVLSHITANNFQLSLEYVHDVSMRNLEKMSNVTGELLASFLTEAALAICILAGFYFLWKKLTSPKGMPNVRDIAANLEALGQPEPGKAH